MKASKNSEKIETEKQKIGNPWVSLNNTEKHILSSFLKEEDTKEVNPSFRILEVTNHFYLSSQILKFSELSTFGKAAYLSYTPLKWVAYLTILPTTKIFYSKTRCLIWSFSGIFFFSYIISNGSLLTNQTIQNVTVFSMLIPLTLFHFILKENIPPKKSIFIFFKLSGFLSCLLWSCVCCDCIINILKSLNIIFDYGYTFMVLGLLSAIIWIPTYFSSFKAIVALGDSLSMSGVVLNCTLIPGFCICIQSILYGKQTFQIYPQSTRPTSVHLLVVLIGLMGVLVFKMIWMVKSNFKVSKEYGKVLLTFYCIGLAYSMVVEELFFS